MTTSFFALFDDRQQADTAVRALLAARFTTGDIDAVTEVSPGAQGVIAEAVRKGAVLVAVRALGTTGSRAREILQAAGAAQIDERPFSWQNQGWEGFEIAPSDVEVQSTAQPRQSYRELHGDNDDANRLEGTG
jgi:hypothetical protein